MSIKLLTEHYLEFLNLKGGCTGLSESTLVKRPHCWKSHVAAQLYFFLSNIRFGGVKELVKHGGKVLVSFSENFKQVNTFSK